VNDATTPETLVGDRAALSRLRLPELQALAAQHGLSGVSQMRKGDLVTALSELTDGASPATEQDEAPAAETTPEA
jgi:transcription termination factor Rho